MKAYIGAFRGAYRKAAINIDIGSIFNALFLAYKSRVEADSGSIASESLTNTMFTKLRPTIDSIQFAWAGIAGRKLRTSTIYDYYTKLYDMGNDNNDAPQTTENDQTYLTGQIAPNENEGMKNPNGDDRHVVLTTPISRSNVQEWTLSFGLNWDGSANAIASIIGKGSDTLSNLMLRNGSDNKFSFQNESGVTASGAVGGTNQIIGKNKLLHFVADGTSLDIYVGAVFVETLTVDTDVVLSQIVKGSSTSGRGMYGRCNMPNIYDRILTLSEMQSENTFYLSIYPEIPSVLIGSQTWQTSNVDMVATPEGNVIAEVTENDNVETITNVADREFTSDTGFWQTSGDAVIGSGLLTFSSAGEPSGIQKILTTKGMWYKITLNIQSLTGTIKTQLGSGSTTSITYTLSGVKTVYQLADGADDIFFLVRDDTCDAVINSISVEEVGWAGSQDLYDGLIAQGESVYDATKAAVMWCYYNNDSQIGSWAGKLYNGAARDVLVADIATEGDWGYHLSTKAEWTALLTNEEVTLKKEGTDYWLTTGGTNTTSFTALGGASRLANGTFGTIKNYVAFWCADTDEVVKIYHDGTAAEIVAADLDEGAYIRFVKD